MNVTMDAGTSERLFSSYLDNHSIVFKRDFLVCGERNVDFKVQAPTGTVLCDVKEVRDSGTDRFGEIDAYTHIRGDLKNLREKFGRNKPIFPVVLTTMNFSSSFFTAHTVARAMYGDIGAELSGNRRGQIHHLPRGNASMTGTTNTSISGILVFDCRFRNHAYFSNEYAKIRLPSNYFPDVEEYDLRRCSDEKELLQLSELVFWGYDENRKP